MVRFKDQQSPFVSNAATKRMKTKIETKYKGERMQQDYFQLSPRISPQDLLMHHHYQEQVLPEFWLGNCYVVCSNGASGYEHFQSMGCWKLDTSCKTYLCVSNGCGKDYPSFDSTDGTCKGRAYIDKFFYPHASACA